MNSKYKFYACVKFPSGGCVCDGRNDVKEAYRDLNRLHMYLQNGVIFIGVVKCSDAKPLSHIQFV